MKQERILYALGNVSESFIIESMPAARTRQPVKWLVPICAAAVLLILSGVTYQIAQMRRNAEMETAEAETEPAEIEITAQTEVDAGGMVTESSSGDWRFVDVKELLASAGGGQTAATEELTQKIVQIPIGSYTAVYEGVGNDGGEAFREELYASRGSVFLENEGLYYVSGHTDKQYLIQVQDNEVSLWKFVCFDTEGYPYRDVLTQIYDVHSADGFAELIVSAGNMDNTPEGIRIQQEIGTRSITDRHSLHELYRILGSMTCYGQDQWDRIQLGSQDADTSGDMENMHQEVRMTRYLTIVTPYHEIDRLKYTAVSGMFYEFDGIAYEPLSETDAQIMRDMLGIDASRIEEGSAQEDTSNTEWHDTTAVSDENHVKPALESLAQEGIQERISAAMAGGELPFVVSSSYREDIGKIIVTVTTQDESELNKLRAFDPDGRVLIIEYDPDGGAALE